MSNGAIIVGYQGVGKSTLSYHQQRVIDLESSYFFVDGKRDENWHIAYCNIARNLCRQGYIVCVSSHKIVRDELAKNPASKQFIVYPCLALKDKWIKNLEYRYNSTPSDKNYKAWKNAECCYDENIQDLINQEGFEKIEIPNMSYYLYEMLRDRSDIFDED